MLKPEDVLAVTLTAAEWNQVLAILSRGKYHAVAPLIGKIHEQGMAAHGGGQGPLANGADKHNSGDHAYVPD